MPEKKSSPKTKADIEKNKKPVKKSSTVKKELTPLTAKETKTTEKKSVTLLKEAINTAKNKALDNKVVAKPIKKKSTSVKKTEEKLDKPEKIAPVKKDTPKETYTKADIIKPSVMLEKEKKPVDTEVNDNNITPPINNPTYTKESILSILTRSDNSENKEEMLKESIKNLQDKIKSKQEEEAEIKKNIDARNRIDSVKEKQTPSYPEVKDTTSSNTPNYSYSKYTKPEKKESKKPFMLIFAIILIIAGASFGVLKFVLNKEDTNDVPVNEYVEVEEPLEDATDDSTSDTGSFTVPTSVLENYTEETPKEELVTEEATPKVEGIEKETAVETTPTPKTNEVETPPTPVAPTPPVAPKTPTEPEIVTPTVKAPTKPYIIAWKDTLQSIAISELGDIRRWPTIYSLNKNMLNSPDSYKFGTTIHIPINKIEIENMDRVGKESLYNDYLITIEAYKKINNPGMVIILERDIKTLKLK